MDGRDETNTGPSSPLERLSDDLVLRILVLAAQADQTDIACFKSDYGAIEKVSSVKAAALERLCKLRTVCSQFDRLILQVESVLWWCGAGQVMSAGAIRFLQENQALKCVRLSRPPQHADNEMPLAFLLAVPQAKPHLEEFEVFGADICQARDEETHILFNVLSTCPKLRVLRLLQCSANLYEPLSARHTLKSLRTLELQCVFLTDACVASILSACPSLEILVIEEVEELESPIIKSSTLQRLSISSESNIPAVTLQTPELRYLQAYACDRLVVDAPLLDHLVLGSGHEWNIVKVAPWQVSVLDIVYAGEPMGQLTALFKMCPDAKELTMRAGSTLSANQGSPILRIMLSELLAPLPRLENVSIPDNLTGSLDLEEDTFLFAPFAKLQHLKIGFENLPRGALEIVMKLTNTAPGLKSVQVDLQALRFAPIISSFAVDMDREFSGFMRFQKKHPCLDITVKWPRHCYFQR